MKYLAILLGVLTLSSTATAQSFVVVVNAANPITVLSRQTVSDIFLKRVTMWKNEQSIVSIDQAKRSAVRAAFTKEIHTRSVSAIESYWQTQIFSGKDVPPAMKAGDDAVLAFVRATPNAIGYVSADAKLGDSVKTVTVSQ